MRWFVVAGLAVASVVLNGCASVGSPPVGSLELAPSGDVGTEVTGDEQLDVTGDTDLLTVTTRVDGGAVELVEGPDDSLPTALRFPTYAPSGGYPRAVLRLKVSGGTALDPGENDFEFGATFRLDADSTGRVEDNGDNVFQRGLASEPTQLKLELDGGHPACTVKGDDGRAVVRARRPVEPGEWLTVTCSRVGDRVAVEVAPLDGGEPPTREAVTQHTGLVRFEGGRPASVGGKLTTEGDIVVTATDQFNGSIARVWVARR